MDAWEQLTPRPKAAGRPVSPLTSHQFALTTAAAPAVVWTALTDGDLTRRYLTGQVLRAEPSRQLSYLLQSGPHDPATFLTWQLRTVSGGTTLRLQVDEIEGSSEDDAEDTWLPVLAALHAMLDPAPARTKPATEEQAGPASAAPII